MYYHVKIACYQERGLVYDLTVKDYVMFLSVNGYNFIILSTFCVRESFYKFLEMTLPKCHFKMLTDYSEN